MLSIRQRVSLEDILTLEKVKNEQNVALIKT